MVIDGATPMLGGRARTSIDMLLVRIDTDAGVTGWGEAFGHRIFPATRAAIDTLLGPDVRRPRPEPDRRAQRRPPARAARGRAATGRRCTRCRGSTSRCGTSRARSPACRSTGCSAAARARTCPPTRACSATARRAAVAHYTEQALDARLPPHQAPRDHGARGARPRATWRAPTCRSWSTRTARGRWPQAIEMARRLAPLDLHWLEEPVWPPENLAGLAEVRARGGIPTAAGENYGTAWEFRRAFEAGALTYAQPSVTKIGGVTELRRVMTLARDVRRPRSSRTPRTSGPACSRRSTASPRCRASRWSSASTATSPRTRSATPSIRSDGRIAVPQGPGLGVDPDARLVEKLRTG